jgi:hypothetical protein
VGHPILQIKQAKNNIYPDAPPVEWIGDHGRASRPKGRRAG